MERPDAEPRLIREEFDRIASWEGFAGNERLTAFLRFIVEQHLAGARGDIKEAVLGTEVFGRSATYDPKKDSIVRTEAGRLRARLAEYYAGPGTADALIIAMPKGAYRPTFTLKRAGPQVAVRSPRRRWPALAAAVVLAVAAIGFALPLVERHPKVEADHQAYELYVRGRARSMWVGPGLTQGIALLEEAVAKEPTFAPAAASLAAAYAFRSIQFTEIHAADEMAEVQAALRRAIELDPQLADVHTASGLIHARTGEWALAEGSFRQAASLAPHDPRVYADWAMWGLFAIGRVDEALALIRTAERLDPLSPEVSSAAAWLMLSKQEFEAAERYCEKLPEGYSLKVQCFGRVRLGQGRFAEAIEIFEQDALRSANPQARGFLGYAYARAGRLADAEKLAAAGDQPNANALIFAGLRDKERTIEALRQMSPLGPQRVGRYLQYPELAFLKLDPGLALLRRSMGLPEA